MTVVRCAGAPLPPLLMERTRVDADDIPTRHQVEDALSAAGTGGRVIVCGTDAGLAAVVTRALRAEALHTPFAFVSDVASPATRAYGLPTGAAAARLALEGSTQSLPLVRDDTGTVLVGSARMSGPEGAGLEGEAYADDTRVFAGTIPWLEIRPDVSEPGVLAVDGRRSGVFRRHHSHRARAVQLGTPGAVVTRDGVPGRRPVKRSSFYRHADPWLLVRP